MCQQIPMSHTEKEKRFYADVVSALRDNTTQHTNVHTQR